jgi:Large ribosomal RNA subunit accumulation protein YceD
MTELARPFAVKRIGDSGAEFALEANAAECAAIAARLLIPGVSSLQCRWRLHPAERGSIRADGVLRASVTQLCVVTVEPFPAEIAESFTVRFVLEDRLSEEGDDPDEPDELIYDGVTLELGEAAVEQLALALDPYPRAPGAVLPDLGAEEGGGAFAALAELRKPN